jgi:hypothetical protein
MTFNRKAKNLNLKSYEVNMGMFDYTIRFIIGDHKKAIEMMNWFHNSKGWYDNGDEPKGQCFHIPPYCPVIWLPRIPRTIAERATLAHECCHATMRLFHWAGMPIDMSTDEVFAHSVSYLIESFSKQVK